VATEQQRREAWVEYARELGLNLHRARESKGISQERLAHKAGISAFTYLKYEKGESRPGTPMNPRLSTLIALCQALDLTMLDVLPLSTPDMTGGR
jgi:transcriptional regulator with XRE-family HTH domain